MDLGRNIMELYNSRKRRKNSYSVIRDRSLLRSLGPVAFLHDFQKFGTTDLKPTQNSINSSQENDKQDCEKLGACYLYRGIPRIVRYLQSEFARIGREG